MSSKKTKRKGSGGGHQGKLTFDQRSWEVETMSQGVLSGTGTAAFLTMKNVCPEHPFLAAWWWAQHGCAACKRVEAEKTCHFCQSPEAMKHWPNRVKLAPLQGSGSLPNLGGLDDDDELVSAAEIDRRNRKQALLAERYPYLMPRLGTDMIDRFTGRTLLAKRIMPILGRTFTAPTDKDGPWR